MGFSKFLVSSIHSDFENPSLISSFSVLQWQQEVSPLTSGRLSHSSGPLNGAQSCGSLTDSPPVSPSEIDDFKVSFPVIDGSFHRWVFEF